MELERKWRPGLLSQLTLTVSRGEVGHPRSRLAQHAAASDGYHLPDPRARCRPTSGEGHRVTSPYRIESELGLGEPIDWSSAFYFPYQQPLARMSVSDRTTREYGSPSATDSGRKDDSRLFV